MSKYLYWARPNVDEFATPFDRSPKSERTFRNGRGAGIWVEVTHQRERESERDKDGEGAREIEEEREGVRDRAKSSGFRVQGLRLSVWGSGFRV